MRIDTIDAHTAGEPLRIFFIDKPELSRGTILDRRSWMIRNADQIRKVLLWEPRGHREMYGCIVVPPERSDSDFGVLFLHNDGYSTMCGHGIIAVTTALLETGALEIRNPEELIRIDTPAGLIVAQSHVDAGRVHHISFENVSSFVSECDLTIDVPGYGALRMDVAFGGAFYAYVDAHQVGCECLPDEYEKLVSAGRAIKKAVAESVTLAHPHDERLNHLYGTIFVAASKAPGTHSRNVCIFADGQVDRSPTGTGVSGRLAIHHARGEVGVGDSLLIESILGTTFRATVTETGTVGPFDAITPRVEGEAYVTGKHSFFLDPRDPLPNGFLL
jgi:trans-L-3-hydroxyproline dehydratase